jgi:outer membrane protein TolC
MMNWINRVLFLIFITSIPGWLSAQQPVDSTLKLSDAVAIAMKKNHDILVARNTVRIAEINKGILNSGFLPSLNGAAGASYSKNNTDVTLISGDEISKNGAASTNYNASLGLNYRLFDGMNRHYNFKVLKENYTLAELQARAVIENSLIALIRSYYEVARLTARLENLKRTINISNTRLEYMHDKYNYGQATELDFLNAKVDRNNDSVNYINTVRQLEIARNNLKVTMGENMAMEFTIDTLVAFGPRFNQQQMLENARNKNVDYLIARQNRGISDLQLKQSHSGYVPTLDLSGKYSYNQMNSDVSSFTYQQSNGYNVGASLNWNIFDGGRTRTRELNAKINVENAQIKVDKTKNELERQVADAYSNYTNMLFILKTEEGNKKINELNFKRSVEQYKLGQLTSIDFRKAQVNLQLSVDNYNEALYNAKVAELELMKLAGLFLDEL